MNRQFLEWSDSDVVDEFRKQWASEETTPGDDDDLWSVASVRGASIDAIVGVVALVYGRYELLPRTPGDVDAGRSPAGGALESVTIKELQDVSDRLDGDDSCLGDRDVSDNSPYILRTVAVSGVVSATGAGEFFLAASGTAKEWEGILVTMEDAPTLAVGTPVAVAGTTIEYGGQTQLVDVLAMKTYENKPATPKIAPIAAKTGWLDCVDAPGFMPESLEGTLIKLEHVSIVSDADPLNGQVLIDDGSGVARLDDRLLDTDKELMLRWNSLGLKGHQLRAVIGVVTYAYGTFQISPRDANDLVYGVVRDDRPDAGAGRVGRLVRLLVLLLFVLLGAVLGAVAAAAAYYRWALAHRPTHARVVGQTLGAAAHFCSLNLCCCFGAAGASDADADANDVSITTEYDFAPRDEGGDRELV